MPSPFRKLAVPASLLAVVVALGALTVGCASGAPSDDETESSDLTSGAVDRAFGSVTLPETFIGGLRTKLFFLGADAGGMYVARRTSRLQADASYGAAGKAYVIAAADLKNNFFALNRNTFEGATVLADGRVALAGYRTTSRNAERDWGMGSQLLVGLVSSDGRRVDSQVVAGPSNEIEPGSTCPAYDTPMHRGTAVLGASDGSVLVGASASCIGANQTVQRLYRFSVGATGLTYAGPIWQGALGAMLGARDAHANDVARLHEGDAGHLLVAAQGDGAMAVSTLDTAVLGSPTSKGAITALSDADSGLGRNVVLAKLPGGSFLGVAMRNIGTLRTFTLTGKPEADSVRGFVTAGPRLSFPKVVDVIRAVAVSPNRVLVVAQAMQGASYNTLIIALTERGALDTTFASNGVVEINETTPYDAYTNGTFLYVSFGTTSWPMPMLTSPSPTIPAQSIRRVRL